jgi:ribonuclease HI
MKLIEIYTDGSFDLRSKEYSYAIIIMQNGEVIKILTDKALDTTGACQHMGEITAIMNAVKFAKEENAIANIFTDSIHAYNIVNLH